MKFALLAAITASLAGCATSSGVMESGNGVYLVGASATPSAGGVPGAQKLAYEEATKFCAAKSLKAVVVNLKDRDSYQSAGTTGWTSTGGASSFSSFATGNVQLAFRCS